MKKTTWAIISLSVLVVALSIVLVLVIIQKKTETIVTTEPDHFRTIKVFSEPWQPSRPFSIASDYTKTKIYYYGKYTVPYRTPELDKEVDFFGERTLSVPYKWYMLKRPYQTKEEKKQ